jgi:hemoglobin
MMNFIVYPLDSYGRQNTMQQANSIQNSAKFHSVTEESIRLLIETFYEGVRKDDVLGPVFEKVLDGKWSTHMPRMYDFWSKVLLRTKRFQGDIYVKHMVLAGITEEHFARWLTLFRNAVTQLYHDEAADRILKIADSIAENLQLGFFGEQRVRM